MVVVDCGSGVEVGGGVVGVGVVAGDGVDEVDNTLQSVEPVTHSPCGDRSQHDSMVSQVENKRHSL